MSFATGGTHRSRITSTGQVAIGTDTASGYTDRMLTLYNPTTAYLEVRTNAGDNNSGIIFSKGAAQDADSYRGYIAYNHSTDYMTFHTGGGTRRGMFDANGLHFDTNNNSAATGLDDYEEGSWTGVIATGGGTVNNTWYTKVGNIVFVTGSLSAWGDTTSSTAITVTGLPFTCSSKAYGKTAWCKHEDAHKGPWCEADSTTVRFLKSSTSTGSCDYMYHSGIVQSSGSAAFSLWYNVA